MVFIDKDNDKFINFKKKNFFVLKYTLVKNFNFKINIQRSEEDDEEKIIKLMYDVGKDLENFYNLVLEMHKVKIFALDKKKIESDCYVKMKCFLNKKVIQFLDVFFVKYVYLYIKDYDVLLNDYIDNEEDLKEFSFNNKFMLTCSSIAFKVDYYKKFFELDREKVYYMDNDNIIPFTIKINSNFIKYVYLLILTIVINSFKQNIFLYKKFKSNMLEI